MRLLDWLKPERPRPELGPPTRAPKVETAPADPWGLPDFLSRMRIGVRAPLSAADIKATAKRLHVPGAVLHVVVQAETDGQRGFGPSGLPTILFEPHLFSEVTQAHHDGSSPDISYPERDVRKYPQSEEVRWRQLAKAFALDSEAALLSTRWGAFQILGANYAACGFPSASALAATLAGSEARQLEAFETLLARQKLGSAMRAKKWGEIAAKIGDPADSAARARKMAGLYKAL
jgi:hypothetical protein